MNEVEVDYIRSDVFVMMDERKCMFSFVYGYNITLQEIGCIVFEDVITV